jgi:hypothetical protein
MPFGRVRVKHPLAARLGSRASSALNSLRPGAAGRPAARISTSPARMAPPASPPPASPAPSSIPVRGTWKGSAVEMYEACVITCFDLCSHRSFLTCLEAYASAMAALIRSHIAGRSLLSTQCQCLTWPRGESCRGGGSPGAYRARGGVASGGSPPARRQSPWEGGRR